MARIFSISTSAPVHRRLRLLAAHEDVSMSDLVARLVNEYWDTQADKPAFSGVVPSPLATRGGKGGGGKLTTECFGRIQNKKGELK